MKTNTARPGQGASGGNEFGNVRNSNYTTAAVRPQITQLDAARRSYQAAYCRARTFADLVTWWRHPEFWPDAEMARRALSRAYVRYRRIARKAAQPCSI